MHSKIEEIDRRGKALFKAKQYVEAASTFSEAVDLIEETGGEGGEGGAGELSAGLNRQLITLMNNRSAMYEKASLPDLAISDVRSPSLLRRT